MKRPCDVENANDFHKYYQGWVCIENKEGQEVVPIKFRGMAANNKLAFYRLHKNNDGGFDSAVDVVLKWEEAIETINFGSPPIGMISNEEEVLYGASLAERQSNRGLLLERTRFHSFNRWHLRHKFGQDTSISPMRYDVVWQVFNPAYPSLSKAIAKLHAGESVGEPLSKSFALYTLPDKIYPLLAYKRWTIGYLPTFYQAVLGEQFKDYEDTVRNELNVQVQIQ